MEWVNNFVKMYNGIDLEDYIGNRSVKIYHYTSPTGFQNIIKNKSLRFTDRLYLNDKSEGSYCLDLCLKNIDLIAGQATPEYKQKLIEMIKYRKNNFAQYYQQKKFNIFQCSFSYDDDNLCLWNYYSKNTGMHGYNLQFDSRKLCNSLIFNHYNESVPRVFYGKVIYDQKKQIDIICDICNLFYQYWQREQNSGVRLEWIIDYSIDKILYIGSFFKGKYFSVEKEYRLIIYSQLEESGSYKLYKIDNLMDFFERDGIFIPYVDINFKPEALLSVRVSPTIDKEQARTSIMRIAEGYSNLKNPDNIRYSGIPVRY